MTLHHSGYKVQDGWLYSGAVRLPIRAEQVAPSVPRVYINAPVILPVNPRLIELRARVRTKKMQAMRAKIIAKYSSSNRKLTEAERIGCSGPVKLPYNTALAIAKDRWYRVLHRFYGPINAYSSCFNDPDFVPYGEGIDLAEMAGMYPSAAKADAWAAEWEQFKAMHPTSTPESDIPLRPKVKVKTMKGGPVFKSFESLAQHLYKGTHRGRTRRTNHPGNLVSTTVWIDHHLMMPDGMIRLSKVEPGTAKVMKSKIHMNMARKALRSNDDGSTTIHGRLAVANVAAPLLRA